ncbi:MAG TPA: helix-turn-helix transcriptional regulator [Anaerolineae bacterium]|nr:helix-turn-helix transcriptional regulator [Anaerolineae bacterium]
MLGARLRVIRKKKAYTLAEVGNQTGLSVSFLSDIERGRTQPSLDTLEKLSNCYQVPLNDMLDNMDGDALASGQAYPPGFDEFLRDTEIEPELVDLLLKIERRATRPATTKEDWLQYYYSLKTILGR